MDLSSHAAPAAGIRVPRHHPSLHMQECVHECLNAYQAALTSLQYCIQSGGDTLTDPMLLKNLEAAVEISLTAARFMLLQSPFHRDVCHVCARVLRAAAKSALPLEQDAVLSASVEHFLNCAENCERMAQG